MESPAQVLFERIDYNLDHNAKEIRNRVFSEYRDVPWTREQYRILQPLIRKELENLVYFILANLDDVGCVLPPDRGFLGYSIKTTLCEERMRDDVPLLETIEKEEVDIRVGDITYCDMWLDFLREKAEKK